MRIDSTDRMEEERVAEDELARRSSCTVGDVRRFLAMGLIAPPSAGTYPVEDVMRIRLLLALESSGVVLDDLAAAVREGRLSLGFAGQLVADAPGLTDRSHQRSIADLGLSPELARRLQLAFGLPTGSSEDSIREDDLELLTMAARALEAGLPEEPLLRALRAFSINVRQIVEVQRDLFRQGIEQRLLASGVEHPDMLEATAGTRLRLQRLGYRTVFLLLRRFLERAVFENLVDRIEEALDEQNIARTDEEPPATIVFVDLSGYTRLTEEAGDERAAEHGARLVEIVLDHTAWSGGRLVKSLGDGVMLRFREAAEGVLAALDIIRLTEEAGLPAARAGVATGPVIQREGDYFGRTVNLAARLVDAAEPRQVLASEATAKAAAGHPLIFRSAGTRTLGGFKAPIPLFVAARS